MLNKHRQFSNPENGATHADFPTIQTAIFEFKKSFLWQRNVSGEHEFGIESDSKTEVR